MNSRLGLSKSNFEYELNRGRNDTNWKFGIDQPESDYFRIALIRSNWIPMQNVRQDFRFGLVRDFEIPWI